MSGQFNGGVFNPHNLKLFSYTYNNPVNFVDPDGESLVKAGTTGVKLIHKAYKMYRKNGKIDSENLKQMGMDELVGVADDLNTIFIDDAKDFFDKLGAGVDLIMGTETTDGVIREATDTINIKSNKKKGMMNKRTLQNTNIKKQKVSMDIERGGSGKTNIHLKVDKTKYFYDGVDFVNTAGSKAPNSITKDSRILKAIEHTQKEFK